MSQDELLDLIGQALGHYLSDHVEDVRGLVETGGGH